MKYLIVKLGNNKFAIEMESVVEIIIPGVAGRDNADKIKSTNKMTYRKSEADKEGQIPVFNLCGLAQRFPVSNMDNFKVVVCEWEGELIGLIVDNADEILKLTGNEIMTASNITPDVNGEIISGYAKEDSGNLYIISLEAMFSLIRAS